MEVEACEAWRLMQSQASPPSPSPRSFTPLCVRCGDAVGSKPVLCWGAREFPPSSCALVLSVPTIQLRSPFFFLDASMQAPGTLHPLFSVRETLSRLMVLCY